MSPHRKRFRDALLIGVCLHSPPSPLAQEGNADVLRYVVDQESGAPVAGALVIATWRSVSAKGHQVCNRAESYISAADGSFRTPNDPIRGDVVLGAYKKGYERGNTPKGIQAASDGDYRHAQIAHYKWNDSNTRAEVIFVEPRIYADRALAMQVSRERTDAFLRKTHTDRAGRLQELHRLRVEGICEGDTLTTDGVEVFFTAILEEQTALGDADAQLKFTADLAKSASKPAPR